LAAKLYILLEFFFNCINFKYHNKVEDKLQLSILMDFNGPRGMLFDEKFRFSKNFDEKEDFTAFSCDWVSIIIALVIFFISSRRILVLVVRRLDCLVILILWVNLLFFIIELIFIIC